MEQVGDLALHFLLHHARLVHGVPRCQAVVAVQFDDERPRARRADEAGERFVVDGERAGVGEQVQRVGDQVVEVGGQHYVERAAGERHQARQRRVPEAGKSTIAKAFYLPLSLLCRKEQILHY